MRPALPVSRSSISVLFFHPTARRRFQGEETLSLCGYLLPFDCPARRTIVGAMLPGCREGGKILTKNDSRCGGVEYD